jgi:hypothetical protein
MDEAIFFDCCVPVVRGIVAYRIRLTFRPTNYLFLQSDGLTF